MKKIVLTALLFMLPLGAHAASVPVVVEPRWALEIKGGDFIPDIPNWAAYYDKRATTQYSGSLAYKITPLIEAGIEVGRSHDEGRALGPGHTADAGGFPAFAGSAVHDIFPLNVFVLLRGIVSDDQWVIPYVAGGFTRIYYRDELKYQPTARGYADGYHGRAGLQFPLDGIDADTSKLLSDYLSIKHFYLFIEAERTRAMIDTEATATSPSRSVNLGGMNWLLGFRFEI